MDTKSKVILVGGLLLAVGVFAYFISETPQHLIVGEWMDPNGIGKFIFYNNGVCVMESLSVYDPERNRYSDYSSVGGNYFFMGDDTLVLSTFNGDSATSFKIVQLDRDVLILSVGENELYVLRRVK